MARPPLVWRDRNPSTARDIPDSTPNGLQAVIDRAWRAVFAGAYAAGKAAEARRAARCEEINEPQIGASNVAVASPSFVTASSLAADHHAPSWNPDAVTSREPLAASLLQGVLNVAARKFSRAEQRPHPATFARDPQFSTPHNDVMNGDAPSWVAENRHDDDLAIPVLRKRAAR